VRLIGHGPIVRPPARPIYPHGQTRIYAPRRASYLV
jgi:hypothetical protein